MELEVFRFDIRPKIKTVLHGKLEITIGMTKYRNCSRVWRSEMFKLHREEIKFFSITKNHIFLRLLTIKDFLFFIFIFLFSILFLFIGDWSCRPSLIKNLINRNVSDKTRDLFLWVNHSRIDLLVWKIVITLTHIDFIISILVYRYIGSGNSSLTNNVKDIGRRERTTLWR